MFDQTQIKQLIEATEQAWYPCSHQTSLIRGCAVQANKTLPIKHKNKRNNLSF